MIGQHEVIGFVAGVVLATLTTPVGVSGAVFLLPVQLSVLGVPSPRLTPTNLMYNVVAGPGALLRYWRRGTIDRALAGQLLVGSVPGVVVGALVRVHLLAGVQVFRLLAAAVLAPIGVGILLRARGGPPQVVRQLRPRVVRVLAFVIGVVGGLYGIGGGSILGPLLVAAGMSVTVVAPAALASTWITSLVGVGTFAAVAPTVAGPVAPDWSLGVAMGLGGLVGGWTGASLQPHLPERGLRTVLGLLAVALAGLYVHQSLR